MRDHVKFSIIVGVAALCCIFNAAPAFCQQAGNSELRRLTLPGKNWSVDVSLTGLEVLLEEISAGDNSYDLAVSTGMDISRPDAFTMLNVRIESLPSKIVDADVPSLAVTTLRKTKGVKKGSILNLEYNRIPVIKYQRDLDVAYNITQGFGVSIPRQTMDAYLTKDDYWIIVRVSAKTLKEADVNLFHTILDSVKVVDNTHPTSSFDFYSVGRSFYLQKNYPMALGAFNAALKLELANRQLSISQWRGLVENLADSCGATGNVVAAKAALEYGVKNDPTYPIFHLGLARLYAHLGDLDNTIAALEKAFMYKANRARTMPLLDPMYDVAFERFRKNDRFRKAVTAIKK